MTDDLRAALIAATKDPQLSDWVGSRVQQAVDQTLQTSVQAVMQSAVAAAQQALAQKTHDPYRTTVQFLAGLVAFCLAVIVGVFNAFPDPPVDPIDPIYRMLGAVLAWISLTALVGTVSAGVAQILKHRARAHAQPHAPWWGLALLMGVPTAFGAVAVGYCMRGGAAILGGDATLLSLAEAFCRLTSF